MYKNLPTISRYPSLKWGSTKCYLESLIASEYRNPKNIRMPRSAKMYLISNINRNAVAITGATIVDKGRTDLKLPKSPVWLALIFLKKYVSVITSTRAAPIRLMNKIEAHATKILYVAASKKGCK